ncbi:ParB family protein (plasmid) [Vibrio cyclitrophicus]|uniref:ParB family protein n=1 Tax=Vibrio cyclitrophicus TaxID=47951 RepID=UPI000C84A376|nr:ParB family protein [Vibrio cyclitrophicus]PMJ40923.1 hypothetical protein BCU22_12970 [Vibrio cyclitrophicus]
MTGKYGSTMSKDDILGSNIKSQKSSLKQDNGLKRGRDVYEYQFDKGIVKAVRRVISANDVEVRTKPHPLNPRTQNALNARSIGNTFNSINEKGILEDCLGIWSEDQKTILVLEGSVRRYCAIECEKSYPIKVLPYDCASNKELRELIEDISNKKRHSLRERGLAYKKALIEQGFNPDEMKINEVVDALYVGRETIRKCLQASDINAELIEIFPDYEGIPSSFYARIAKVEKELIKYSGDVSEFCNELTTKLPCLESLEIKESQMKVLNQMEMMLNDVLGRNKQSKQWQTTQIISFDAKDKHARMSISSNGRNVKFELGRQSQELIDKIERLIKEEAK